MTKRTIKTLPLTAGNITLDFVNTCDFRDSAKFKEYLNSYEDVLVWAKRVKLLTEENLQRLSTYAQSNPLEADQSLKDIRTLRETLHKVFLSQIGKGKLGKELLERLNNFLSNTLPKVKLVSQQDIGISFDFADNPLKSLPHIIALHTLSLLTSPDANLINVCQREKCGWYFLDRSRRKNRRWCSMAECGNSMKQRRFRRVHAISRKKPNTSFPRKNQNVF